MPARIVVAHDDAEFVDTTVMALRGAGRMWRLSLTACLEFTQLIEVLITRVLFPEGQPNGVAFGLMARMKRRE